MELAGSVRSPNTLLEDSECCHMLDLSGASSKCAEQCDSIHELFASVEGVCKGMPARVQWYAVNINSLDAHA